MTKPKHERLQAFLQQLRDSPPAASSGAAVQLINQLLDAVEDEMTDIPFDPNAAAQVVTDGRMYGPHPSFAADYRGRSDLTRYAHRSHDTFVQDNGAILIRLRRGRKLLLSKPGADGREIEL